MRPIKVLIADDHELVRQGLRLFIDFDKGLEIVGEASDGSEAIKLARQLKPDIVLMDILMPTMDGLEATLVLRQEMPEIEVLILTSVLDENIVNQSIRAGAIGYLLKDTRSDELCRAIHAGASGQVQLSRQAAKLLTRNSAVQEPLAELTQRELEVLRLISQGFSNKEIALELVIAEKTVKVHIGNVFSKLNVNSRTQAAVYAMKMGLVKLK